MSGRVRGRRLVCVCAALVSGWWAATPSSATMPDFQARLQSDVSSAHSKINDPVAAVSIAPVVVNGHVIATAGCSLPGRVVESLRPRGLNAREVVALEFAQLVDSLKVVHPIKTTLIDVDNARESVDEQGRILGQPPVGKKPDDPVDVLKIAAHGIPTLQAMFTKVTGKGPAQINYHPGVEITLRLADPWTTGPLQCGSPTPPAVASRDALTPVVDRQPIRTTSRSADKPADVTNLMFLGTRADLMSAFAAAGWLTADAAGLESSTRTFLAVATGQGYKEGPVSLELLDGKPPDLVFQKQLNTYAKRHHVRIWQRPGDVQGRTVWVGAATHDNGIIVSKESKWFTHGIDPDLDAERAKVVNDLAFAGAVQSMTAVDRPKALRQGKNASGDVIRTDGRMAVLMLQHIAK
jgi:LssY C-terminus